MQKWNRIYDDFVKCGCICHSDVNWLHAVRHELRACEANAHKWVVNWENFAKTILINSLQDVSARERERKEKIEQFPRYKSIRMAKLLFIILLASDLEFINSKNEREIRVEIIPNSTKRKRMKPSLNLHTLASAAHRVGREERTNRQRPGICSVNSLLFVSAWMEIYF